MNETILETKSCAQCGASFNVMERDREFYDQISPSFGSQKYIIPNPTFCPDCRQQRRMSFRNERSLYTRKCDSTGESIISIYSPDKHYTVYNQNTWWSDDWDPLSHGKDLDTTQAFFPQFQSFMDTMPLLATTIQNSENCGFTNDTGDSKDCYMSSRTHYSSDILYGYRNNRSHGCVDCYQVKESENLYESFQCNKCQNSKYLYKCNDTHSSLFLWNCIGCSDCILSYNLNNAQYCILNQKYSKEEYIEKRDELMNSSEKFQEAKQLFFQKINSEIIYQNLDNVMTHNSIWNEMISCNDCYHCYMMKSCEGSRYAWDNVNYKNGMDNYSGWDSEYCYETTAAKKSFKNIFTFRTKESHNLFYSMFCFSCQDCFGCIWLTGKQFCILNKQYTQAEYNEIVPNMIETMQRTWEWWEFFPSSISPFGYNETVAHEYFPLDQDKAQELGMKWSDYEAPFPKVKKTIPADKLPENISDIPDDILNWAIVCEESGKPFRIVPQELAFYRKHNLPVPKRHPDVRHTDRISLRNKRKLFESNCSKCWVDMQTTYSPDSSKQVYCEDCYSKQTY